MYFKPSYSQYKKCPKYLNYPTTKINRKEIGYLCDDGKFFALGESERLLYRNCEHECRDKESRI